MLILPEFQEACRLFVVFRDSFFLRHPSACPEDFAIALGNSHRLLLERVEQLRDIVDQGTYDLFVGKVLNLLPEYSERCEKSLRAALLSLDSKGDALNELGECVYKKGDPWSARACFESSLQIVPSKEALRNLAVILRDPRIVGRLSPEQRAQSLVFSREAVELDPEDGTSLHLLGNALMTEYFSHGQRSGELMEEAIERYTQAAQSPLTEFDSDFYLNKGSAHCYVGEYAEAFESLFYAYALNPHSAHISHELQALKKYLTSCHTEVKRKGYIRKKKLDNLLANIIHPCNVDGEIFQPVPIKTLREGLNSGCVTTGVVVSLVRNEKNIPYSFCILDGSTDECLVVDVYNCAPGFGVKIEQSVSILDPFFSTVRLDIGDQPIELRIVRVSSPCDLLINGKQCSVSKHVSLVTTRSQVNAS